jgi:hypothetical protein
VSDVEAMTRIRHEVRDCMVRKVAECPSELRKERYGAIIRECGYLQLPGVWQESVAFGPWAEEITPENVYRWLST